MSVPPRGDAEDGAPAPIAVSSGQIARLTAKADEAHRLSAGEHRSASARAEYFGFYAGVQFALGVLGAGDGVRNDHRDGDGNEIFDEVAQR